MLLLVLGAAAGAQEPRRIIIRVTSALPDSVGAVLLDVGLPTTRWVEANVNVEEELKSFCGGSVTNQYRTAFATLNNGKGALLPSDKRRGMQFPACARVQRNVDVPVLPTDTLATLLERELGATAQTKLLLCQPDLVPAGPGPNPSASPVPGPCRAEPVLTSIALQVGQPDGEFNKLPTPRKSINLLFRSRSTTVLLKPAFTPDAAIQRLNDAAGATAAGADLLTASVAPDLDLLAPMPVAVDEAPCIDTAEVSDAWPFDREALKEVLIANLAHLRGRPERSVIRVADTGVLGMGDATQFPAGLVAVNRGAHAGVRDRDTGYTGAIYGIDPELGGDVRPRDGDPFRLHGTQVADLALGTAAFRTTYPQVADLLALTAARVFTKATGRPGVVAVPTMLNSSILFRPPGAHIINFSLGGTKPLPDLLPVLANMFRMQQLVVIAAGNGGADLGNDPLWPASYAAEEAVRNAMIVVGAHGPPQNGVVRMLGLSNRGSAYVDLVAPGCRLRAPFGAEMQDAGTSFAAPLVSFTAGLLRTFLSTQDSKNLRHRLWATVRWMPGEIDRQTAFRGMLDIPAALRLFDDVVRLRGGGLVPGRWDAPPTFHPCAELEVRPEDVLRVRVERREGQAPMLYLLTRDRLNKVQERDGCAATSDGPRLIMERGPPVTYAWDELETLIPAFDIDDHRVGLPLTGSADPERGDGGLARPIAFGRPGDTAQRSTLWRRAACDDAVAATQEALSRQGMKVDRDCVLGPRTRSAIREWQLLRMEAPTGELSAMQRRALLPDAQRMAPKPDGLR